MWHSDICESACIAPRTLLKPALDAGECYLAALHTLDVRRGTPQSHLQAQKKRCWVIFNRPRMLRLRSCQNFKYSHSHHTDTLETLMRLCPMTLVDYLSQNWNMNTQIISTLVRQKSTDFIIHIKRIVPGALLYVSKSQASSRRLFLRGKQSPSKKASTVSESEVLLAS